MDFNVTSMNLNSSGHIYSKCNSHLILKTSPNRGTAFKYSCLMSNGKTLHSVRHIGTEKDLMITKGQANGIQLHLILKLSEIKVTQS